MSVLAVPPVAGADHAGHTRAHRTAPACAGGVEVGVVVRRLAANLAVACVVPAAILYVVLQTVGLAPALLAALAWTYGASAWRKATGRPTSGLLVLAVVVLTVRTAFTLGTGNAYVYFLEPVVTDGLLGLLFLASLATSRPLVARLAADFYPVGPELAARTDVRRLFRRLTLMWAGVGLAKSGLGFWLLETLSTADFVLAKTSLTVGLTVAAVAVTIRAALRVLRAGSPVPST
jgi:uncharacterized membrane protein YidH (DUF202 family)